MNLLQANAFQIPLPPKSVHMVVDSPPYYSLRKYAGEQEFIFGGDKDCVHEWEIQEVETGSAVYKGTERWQHHGETLTTKPEIYEVGRKGKKRVKISSYCSKCQAWRGAYGLEPTLQMYIDHTVEWCREVWRVLRDDGTFWLNLGDSYAGSPTGSQGNNKSTLGGGKATQIEAGKRPGKMGNGLKPKDLMGVPWSVAKALQQPYYTGKIKREIDRVWLAAIIDGEGTITATKYTRKRDGYTRTEARVFITNSDTAMLDHAHSIWPASRTEHAKSGEGHLGDREIFRWIPHGVHDVSNLIAEIYPYLITKQKQATLAWNLMEFMKAAKHTGNKGQPKDTYEKRELLVEHIQALNHGKDRDIPSWCKPIPDMHESGWYLRSDIIWHKPNPMPESVTDRPTKAHEYLFLLTKNKKYYYDADAVREEHGSLKYRPDMNKFVGINNNKNFAAGTKSERETHGTNQSFNPAGRNRRTVWTIATAPYSGAHFATYPPALIEPCIKAGTSEKGACPECGNPWERVVEKKLIKHQNILNVNPDAPLGRLGNQGDARARDGHIPGHYDISTLGWRPTCDCCQVCDHYNRLHGEDDDGKVKCPNPYDPIPATILDPFAGSGTTLQVARKLGRNAIGLDISGEYLDLAKERLGIKGGLPRFENV